MAFLEKSLSRGEAASAIVLIAVVPLGAFSVRECVFDNLLRLQFVVVERSQDMNVSAPPDFKDKRQLLSAGNLIPLLSFFAGDHQINKTHVSDDPI